MKDVIQQARCVLNCLARACLLACVSVPMVVAADQATCSVSAAYDTVEVNKRWLDAAGNELAAPPTLASTVTLTATAPKAQLRVIFPAGDTGRPIVFSSVRKPDGAGSSWPEEVSATFNGATGVTAQSTKDLSNVVLLFSDCSTQKFDGLNGYSRTFSGTGSNAGKTVVGVWIKSGSNKSGDGPGYGEYVGRALKLKAGESFTVAETGLPDGWVGRSGLGTFVAQSGPSTHVVVNQAVAVPRPSISLVKTAGAALDGEVYAMSGGHVITYTYRVDNTGDTWLSSLTIDDDKLGAVGVLDEPIPPGGSAILTLDAFIEEGVTNVATAAAVPCAANGVALAGFSPVSDTDDAVVHVLPALDHGAVPIVKTWYDAQTNLLAAPPIRAVPVVVVASNAHAWVELVFPAGSEPLPAVAATRLRPAGEGEFWPEWVRAAFDPARQTVTAASAKALSNVVLKFTDGTQQKFDGLSQAEQTFSGTGENAGKTLAGVWIKSGSNASGDGPGFGDYFAPALMIESGDSFTVSETGLSGGWTAFEGLGDFVYDGSAAGHVVKNIMPPDPEPGVRIVKTAGGTPDGAVLTLDGAASVTYVYLVENTGNTSLRDIDVIDDKLGRVGALEGPLAPSASATFEKAAWIAATTTNLATVSATPCLPSGESLGMPDVTDDDAAVVRLRLRGSIGDRVWLDADADGIHGAEETGLAGVEVSLLDANGDVLATEVTDATGAYAFTDLLPGTYRVHFKAPADHRLSASLEGDDVARDSDPDPETGRTAAIALAEGGHIATIDAGLWAPAASVSIVKTAGSAADGETFAIAGPGAVTYTYLVENTGNTWLQNIVVVDDKLGVIGTVEGAIAPGATATLAKTATIAADVTNIGAVTASPANPQGDLIANAADVADQDDAVVVVQPLGLASVGDRVWVDANDNGVQDAGELGLPGVDVALQDGDGQVLATTTTDAAGLYLFDNLQAGTYRLLFTPPADTWRFAIPSAGADANLDSDASAETGLTAAFSLSHGQADRSRDVGVLGDVPPGFCSELTIGENFNALVLGDFSASGGDTEGRLAVGGSASFDTNVGYSVGISVYGEALPENLAGVEDMLIVRGDLHDGSFDVNGNVVYGGTRYGPERFGNPSRRVAPLTLKENGNVPDDGSGASFEVLFERIRLASAMIATMADRGVTEKELDRTDFLIHFAGDDPVLNVFNVDAADWNGAQTDIHITAPEYSTVVLNVRGPVIALTNAAIRLHGITNDRILFNYPDALLIQTSGFSHEGAVLAPYADADLRGGYFEGFGVFGGDVTTRVGFEFHHYPFRGRVCSEAQIRPAIQIEAVAGNAPDGEILTVLGGSSVNLVCRVANTGNTPLDSVAVVVDGLGRIGTVPGTLAPGASAAFNATLPAVAADTTVQASASGRPVREDGTALAGFSAVSDADTASIRIGSPATAGGSSESAWLRPDFAVTALEFISTPTLTGEVFSVSVQIDNHGEVSGDAGRLALYLDAPAPVSDGAPAAAFKNVGTLLPGETRTLTFSLTSGNLAGTRHLRAFVDSLGRVQEWSDGDNQLSTTYHLNPIALSIGSTEQGTELSWNSFWGQRYTLYRCTDLAKGFLLYKSNLEATPPVNRHVDAEDNPVRFYKLVVVQP